MLEPVEVGDVIARRMHVSRQALCAFWVQVTGDRDRFAGDMLSTAATGSIVLPLVVRGHLFENPNSIAADLSSLLEESRERVVEVAGQQPFRRVAILLIGRTELCVPQLSSPAFLPEWFPLVGGQVVQVDIEDLTWTAEAPLNSSQAQMDEVRSALYSLEKTLLTRLSKAHGENHNAGNHLWDMIRDEHGKYGDFLEAAHEAIAFIKNPSAYRPSMKAGSSLVARLWVLCHKTPSKDLLSSSKALASGLGLPEVGIPQFHEPLASVLSRPADGESPPRRLARNLLVSVFTGCRLVTAAAHADDYEAYPLTLLRSFSFDLRKALASQEEAIRLLE